VNHSSSISTSLTETSRPRMGKRENNNVRLLFPMLRITFANPGISRKSQGYPLTVPETIIEKPHQLPIGGELRPSLLRNALEYGRNSFKMTRIKDVKICRANHSLSISTLFTEMYRPRRVKRANNNVSSSLHMFCKPFDFTAFFEETVRLSIPLKFRRK
jgi:hypothetical protein